MTPRSTLTLLAVFALNLVACGSMTTPDAGFIVTGGGGGTTGSGGGSGSTQDAGVDAGSACTVSTTSFGDLGVLMGDVTFDNGTTPNDTTDDIITLQAKLENATPGDIMTLELYANLGAFAANDGGVIAPGTYAIAGDEVDYATCGVCVRLYTNATSSAYGDDYMPTSGLVTITQVGNAVGGAFEATVSNLTFRHVRIDSMTFTSTLANDTCASTLTAASYTGTLAAP